MILVDTSAWIEVFRRNGPLDIESVIDFDEIVTCLPVIGEVLQGFREDRAYRIAREALTSLPIVESPLRLEVFEEASQLYRAARRVGLTIRSGADCLVAACAVRNGLSVLHRDRDFSVISRVSTLQARSI